MPINHSDQAREFSSQLVSEVTSRPASEAYSRLAAVLAERTPFRLLDLIGEGLSDCPENKLDPFLKEIAAHASIGGWTVIASVLRQRLPREMPRVLDLTRGFIIQADAWFACDCFGERVLGQALVNEFEKALTAFSSWQIDQNHWVRRSVGVAGHLWAKRARGALVLTPKAIKLLQFYEPMLSEQQIDAAKGVGWALKTLGRFYPEVLFKFLDANRGRKISSVILRKAQNFLPEIMTTAFYKK